MRSLGLSGLRRQDQAPQGCLHQLPFSWGSGMPIPLSATALSPPCYCVGSLKPLYVSVRAVGSPPLSFLLHTLLRPPGFVKCEYLPGVEGSPAFISVLSPASCGGLLVPRERGQEWDVDEEGWVLWTLRNRVASGRKLCLPDSIGVQWPSCAFSVTTSQASALGYWYPHLYSQLPLPPSGQAGDTCSPSPLAS